MNSQMWKKADWSAESDSNDKWLKTDNREVKK